MPHWAKKYIFIVLLLASVLPAFVGAVVPAMLAFGLMVSWLILENRERNKFKFLSGNASGDQFSEWNRDLAAPVAVMEFCSKSEKLAVITDSHRLQVFDSRGIRQWEVKLENPPQALLVTPGDGPVYVAWDQRLETLGSDGEVISTIAFDPPEYKQAYKLHLSENGQTLLLQTPWFIQSFSPDLSTRGPRLVHDDVGNYMKYLALSPEGDKVFIGGALLLEEEGIQARWSLWGLGDEAFSEIWTKEDEGQANSHLRGLHYSRAGEVLVAERYRDGYDILVYSPDGEDIWKRGGGEHPVVSNGGEWILWENPFEGITLTNLGDKEKRWAKSSKEKIRLKHVDSRGVCTVIEGRHLLRFAQDGTLQADDWFRTDPVLVKLSPDGLQLAVARQGRVGVLQLEKQ